MNIKNNKKLIREIREKLKSESRNQSELARKVGVSQSSISKFINGYSHSISEKVVKEICRELKIEYPSKSHGKKIPHTLSSAINNVLRSSDNTERTVSALTAIVKNIGKI